jgi:hypothetical protein
MAPFGASMHCDVETKEQPVVKIPAVLLGHSGRGIIAVKDGPDWLTRPRLELWRETAECIGVVRNIATRR